MMPEMKKTTTERWPDGWLLPFLLQANVISTDDVDRLLDSNSKTVWDGCVKEQLVSDEIIAATVARRFHLPIAVLDHLDSDCKAAVSAEFAREHRVAPLRFNGRVLEIATDNPGAADLENNVAFVSGKRVRLFLASPDQLDRLLDRLYPRQEVIASLIEELRPAEADVLRRGVVPMAGSNENLPLVKLVDALIAQAIRGRASDIHLSPDANGLNVRFRVDGVLHDMPRLPAPAARPFVSRLKVMASLDIADRLRPQDGRAEAFIDGRHVDLRISTLPVRNLGETVVIRILDAGAAPPTLSGLGMTQSEQGRIERVLRGEEGLLLVTGPTGSGKTTTLYSCLRALRQGGISIVTVEDPVEYKLEGITQVQANERIGMTFGNVLRSMMRQDPDVLLVGEIRDADTATIAVQASLTGHRVLSTLHTADAASAVTRMISMGADPTALGQALKGVVAQRLLRRVCTSCRVEVDPSELPAAQRALLADRVVTALYRARGCSACNHTGYHGRLPVAEVLIVTNTIARAIAAGADAARIAELARHAGVRSLWESGMEHVCNGDTTLQELLDNVAAPVVEVENQTPATEHVFTREMIDSLIESISQQPAVTAGDSSAAKARILVADDDRQVRRMFRIGLERAGYNVIEAIDGQAALDLLRRVTIDALLLDINLPKLDGYGVLQAMSDQACPRVPVIVATGHDDPDIADWARELGADDVVTKPIEPRMLTARLEALLSKAAA
jgi:type II secretory ATPase GspE/PulE/Tfp pilus assembly ATPase PilB-like protein/ActR/RegA family two-component response regulator